MLAIESGPKRYSVQDLIVLNVMQIITVINYSSRCLAWRDLFMYYTLTESFCEADLFSTNLMINSASDFRHFQTIADSLKHKKGNSKARQTQLPSH